MALSRFVLPFADVGSGIRPSSGAKLFFLETGTSTPADTFNCPDGATANSNPVVADSKGLFPDIFLQGIFKVILQDKNGVQRWEADPVEFINNSNVLKKSGTDVVFDYDTLNAAVISTTLVDGQSLNIEARTAGNGGGFVADVVLSSTVTENTFYIIQATGVATLSLVLRVLQPLDVRTFGAKNLTDSTLEFQAAIDFQDGIGGGEITSGPDTYWLSNITSGDTQSAIEMKSNVHLILPPGSELTKPPAERAVNGTIIGTGSATNYAGPSNIRLSGFKLNDGDASVSGRPTGDLILLESCVGVEIDNIEFGNSDFHFVDIRACKNVLIHDNKHTNEVLNSAAPYQFDVSTNATQSALFPNDNIKIYRNTQEKHAVLASYHTRVFEFAHQCTSQHIKIYDNVIDNTNNNAPNNVIVGGATENDERYEDISIYGNTFTIASDVSWWIRININDVNPDDGGNPNFIRGLKVYNNRLIGKTSQGIQISMITAGMTDFGDITGVDIFDNDMQWDLDVTTSASWSGINGELCRDFTIRNNKITLKHGPTSYGSFKNLEIIRCNSNQSMVCINNEIKIIGTHTDSFAQLRPVTYFATHLVDLALSGAWHCTGNVITGDDFSPGILLSNYAGLESTNLTGKVSRNFVHGTPLGASDHYSINGNVWLSDGSNNLQYIDFAGSGVVGETEVLQLSNSFKLLNFPLPFKSNGNLTPMLKGILSTTSQDLGAFSMDITKQFLTATTTAGTSIEFNQTTNDDFNVLTGTDGVHMNFNESSFQPLLYSSAFLRILAGI